MPFDRRAFGTVGIYDLDWLTTPGFTRLLDNLAASPGAFSGVRCFGAFTAGARERLQPETSGAVWNDPAAAIDFTATFDALAQLTARGLTPILPLGFFPPAISPSPVEPPAEWTGWKRLVRAFFMALANDDRFGQDAIADWWFESWNEPNEGRFWRGSREQFFALHRATSEAIAETGLAIRLGGPAIAYKPQVEPASGAPWVEAFLRFIASDPALRCDFVSLHRKGTVTDAPPDLRLLVDAVAETAELMAEIAPERFAGIPIVNDEADEKVGFEVPYVDRMTERNASWLAATIAGSAALSATLGLPVIAAADNANLQLVDAPFDGRRSLMTIARPGAATDLLKLPVYGVYELLRLMGDRIAPVVSGDERISPATALRHLATTGEHGVAALLTNHPDADDPRPETVSIDYVTTGVPWPRVNIARFRIDAERSNGYAAAGGSTGNPYPTPGPARLPAIRAAQEIAFEQPIAHDIAVIDGEVRERVTLEPYATVCLWITPWSGDVPEPPGWVDATVEETGVVVRWSPNGAPNLASYEVFLMENGAPGERLSPEPLRAAMWVDTGPPAGARVYGVRAVSVSGVASASVSSPAVMVAR